jgi:hypothetical protein
MQGLPVPAPMNSDSLKVRVARRGDKFIWELHRDGIAQPVRFSVPVFASEASAKASGAEARTAHLARLAKRWSKK